MKIGICDDEQTEIVRIKSIIEGMDGFSEKLELVEFNPSSLFFDVTENYFDCQILITDVYFGDTRWEGKSFDGIEIAKQINRKYPFCKIIFLSQYMDFTEYVYEADHIYFILKKNIEEFLENAIKKAIKTYKSDVQENIIEFFDRGKKTWIRLRDIYSVEKSQRNIVIQTQNDSFTSIKSLKQFLDEVKDEPIVRCNNAALVNLRYIKDFTLKKLVMLDDKEYEISDTYSENVRRAYLKWWRGRM